MKLSWSKKIAFSLLPTVLVCLAVEGVFRLLPAHRDAARTRAGFVVPDPDLIWRLRPVEKGPLATNKLGFRDTAFNPDADVRILLLGDSVSWGDGVPEVRALFPQQLQTRLNASGSTTFEVINTGVPGYSTFQQLRYLKLRGLTLKPQMVILQFCLNDVVERYSAVAAYGGDNVFLGVDTRQAIGGLRGWLVRHSRAFEAGVRFAVGLSRDKQAYDVRALARDTLSPALQAAWQVTLGEIDQIRALTTAQSIPLLLVIAPYRFQVADPQHTAQPQRLLLDYARRRNLPALDLLPPFAELAARRADISLFADANHFSAQGHAVAGALLEKAVRSVWRGGGHPVSE